MRLHHPLTLALLFSVSGCSEFAKNYMPSELITQGSSTPTSYITNEGTIDISKLTITDSDVEKRNELISKAITLSDTKCTLHKASIISNANVWNIGTGSASIIFAGAASVISHAKTASDLAAGAAGTTGVQALVNKQLYADTMGTAILRAIDVSRDKKRAILINGMNDTTYKMSVALADLQAYHDSCSLMAGLQEVTKALDNRPQTKTEIENDIKKLKAARTDANSFTGSDKNKTINDYENQIKEKTLRLMTAKE